MATTTTHARHRPLLPFNPPRCLTPPTRSNHQFVCGKKKQKSVVPQKTNEPTSPRIGCLGQIKPGRSSTGPASAACRTTKFRRRLRKMFWDKSAPAVAGKARPSSAPRAAGARVHACDMDPPLPVVRRARPSAAESGERETTSLWERRRAGEVLEGLQVVVVHCRR